MIQNIETYMEGGLPGAQLITFSALPAVGSTITAGGDTFVYGTDFVGDTKAQCAQSLTAAINGEPGMPTFSPTKTNPMQSVFARFNTTGTHAVVWVISRVPGASPGVSSDDVTMVVTSAGSNLSQVYSGVINVVTPGTPAAAAPDSPLSALYLLRFESITVMGNKSARVANDNTVWIQYGSDVSGDIAVPLQPGQVQNITAPTGTFLRLADLYVDGDAGDGITWIAHK